MFMKRLLFLLSLLLFVPVSANAKTVRIDKNIYKKFEYSNSSYYKNEKKERKNYWKLVYKSVKKAGVKNKMSDKEKKKKIKDVFLPLYNSYRFLIQNVLRYEIHSGKNFMYNPQIFYNQNLNITDKWIIAYEQRLLKFFHQEMEHYRLYTVVSELLSFLDKLTNWYIRLNSARIKGDFGEEDWVNSLNVLFGTMLNLIILLSPFIPFIPEFIYQNLRNGSPDNSPLIEQSIHF